MQRYALRDDQWTKIEGFLPGREGHVGGTAADNRLFVDAVIYRYRTGIPWRDLPERYGDWKATHKRFRRWCESGVFANILKALSLDADAEYMSIDSTSVRAHQHSAGAKKDGQDQAIGRSRGGLTTASTPSSTPSATRSRCHSRRARRTTSPRRCLCSTRSNPRVPRDKGYDSDALVETLQPRHHARHPFKGQPPRTAQDRFCLVSRAQSRRAVLLQTQAIPCNLDTLRQAG